MFRLSKSEFARRAGVHRDTVHRWEAGQNRPEDVRVIQRLAAEFELDLDEALSAAGLRPTEEPATRPSREPPMPPELLTLVRKLADPATPEADREYIRRTLLMLAAMPDEGPHRRTGS